MTQIIATLGLVKEDLTTWLGYTEQSDGANL